MAANIFTGPRTGRRADVIASVAVASCLSVAGVAQAASVPSCEPLDRITAAVAAGDVNSLMDADGQMTVRLPGARKCTASTRYQTIDCDFDTQATPEGGHEWGDHNLLYLVDQFERWAVTCAGKTVPATGAFGVLTEGVAYKSRYTIIIDTSTYDTNSFAVTVERPRG
ncbi:MAG TPA: hypothetical protein VGM17_04370 [Rhizomicrobium sp.]